MLRCLVTTNPCGTDTWAVGHNCQCANCREYVEGLLLPTLADLMLNARHSREQIAFDVLRDAKLPDLAR